MKIYTEKEALRLIQFIVSNEELENTSSIHVSTAKRYLEDFNELQVDYVKEPKYFVVFEPIVCVNLKAIPKKYELEELTDMIRDIGFPPLTFSEEKETKTVENVRVEISEETKDFLETHCNIERNTVGEDTYVLNNLRFKIVEE